MTRCKLTVSDGRNEPVYGHRAIEDHALTKSLLPHEITSVVEDPACQVYRRHVVIPQNARVRRQSCDCNTDVVIYSKHFLLVRSQFSRRTLPGIINTHVRNTARVYAPSTPTGWHVSLIASRPLQILASRLRAHTRLDGDDLVARKQCYRSRMCF